jgi:hypothetical protein
MCLERKEQYIRSLLGATRPRVLSRGRHLCCRPCQGRAAGDETIVFRQRRNDMVDAPTPYPRDAGAAARASDRQLCTYAAISHVIQQAGSESNQRQAIRRAENPSIQRHGRSSDAHLHEYSMNYDAIRP